MNTDMRTLIGQTICIIAHHSALCHTYVYKVKKDFIFISAPLIACTPQNWLLVQHLMCGSIHFHWHIARKEINYTLNRRGFNKKRSIKDIYYRIGASYHTEKLLFLIKWQNKFVWNYIYCYMTDSTLKIFLNNKEIIVIIHITSLFIY